MAFLAKQASTAISVSRRSVSPRFPQPPALRVEVTALARRKRQGFLLLFLFSTYFAVFGRGRLLDHCFHTPPQMAHSGVLVCGCGSVLPCMVSGPETGSRGLTRRFGRRGGIWRHLSPVFGVGAGEKYLLLNRSGESCRDCCLSTSFRTYRSSCWALR